MKTKTTTILRLSIAALSAVLLLPSGCVTGPDGRSAPSPLLLSITSRAAATGARLHLAAHPDQRPAFAVAKATLDSLIHDGNYDPALLAEALRGLPVDMLKGLEGALLVSDLIVVWDSTAGEATRIEKTTWIKPMMEAVRNGLAEALDT
jgi:hypothetical protein